MVGFEPRRNDTEDGTSALDSGTAAPVVLFSACTLSATLNSSNTVGTQLIAMKESIRPWGLGATTADARDTTTSRRGRRVGVAEGWDDGAEDGECDGCAVGTEEGAVGDEEGCVEGVEVGAATGCALGKTLG